MFGLIIRRVQKLGISPMNHLIAGRSYHAVHTKYLVATRPDYVKMYCTKPNIWKDDGKFRIVSLSAKTLDESLNLLRNVFFKTENIAIACELYKDEKAIKELDDYCMKIINDGVSLVAIEKATGKIGAVLLNKIHVKDNPDVNFYKEYAEKCQCKSSRAYMQFQHDLECTLNFFTKFNTDCLYETMFVASLPEFRGNNFGQKLTKVGLEMAKRLYKGEEVKVPVSETNSLIYEPRPKVVIGIATTYVLRNICTRLEFDEFGEISYKNFRYNGETYYSRIGKHTPAITLMAYPLEK